MKGLAICGAICVLASVVVCYEPKECSSAGDCGPNECCRIGMQRYALPECRPMGDLGDPCRMGAEAEDRTLFYPNQIFRFIEESYTLFCPCQPQLVCLRNTCTYAEESEVIVDEYEY